MDCVKDLPIAADKEIDLKMDPETVEVMLNAVHSKMVLEAEEEIKK